MSPKDIWPICYQICFIYRLSEGIPGGIDAKSIFSIAEYNPFKRLVLLDEID